MRMRLIVGVVMLFILLPGAFAQGPGGFSCDRACLENYLDRYLDAMMANDPSLELFTRDCKFTENAAPNSSGGGIRCIYGRLTLTDCTFNLNTAFEEGGAVATDYNSVTLANCTFTSNSATRGGAMNNSHFGATATNCVFIGNSAKRGGAIDGYDFPLYGGDPLTLDNCTFTGNSAVEDGGAVCNEKDGDVTLTNCGDVMLYCLVKDLITHEALINGPLPPGETVGASGSSVQVESPYSSAASWKASRALS